MTVDSPTFQPVSDKKMVPIKENLALSYNYILVIIWAKTNEVVEGCVNKPSNFRSPIFAKAANLKLDWRSLRD